MSKRVAKKNRLKKQQSSHVSDPQRFAYFLPQDEQRLAKETGAAASAASSSNQSQEIHIYIDGKEVTSRLGPHIANAIRASGVRSR